MNQQITKQVMEANKILLKNTFVLAQAEKLFSRVPWFLEARKKIMSKPGKFYKRDYENFEVSAEHIMKLYKIANQGIR
jgi:hypothetical protein